MSTEENPPPPGPSSRRAGHLMRALLAVVGAVGLVALVLVGLLAYVRTPSGTARLLRFGVAAANGAMAGHLDAAGASIAGDRILLRGITLTDPEGVRVGFVEQAEVELVWPALLLGNIEARSVRVLRPALAVAVDEEGSSNLDRAFSAHVPEPPGPGASGPPPPLAFVVHRFEIEDGRLDVQVPDAPPFALRAMALSGGGRYILRSADFRLEVRGNGALDQPTPGPVTVSVQGERAGRRLWADVDLHAAGASLVADLRSERAASLDAHLALDVPPALGHALVPGWPLRVPLALTGEAKTTGSGTAVALNASTGRARLQARAELDVERHLARQVRVEARHVDLRELLGHGPQTDLAVSATGSGSGASWASATARLELEMPATEVRGAAVGPVKASLQVRSGRLEIASLSASLPGLEVQARGNASRRSLEGALTLEVTDLAAWSRVLGDLVGPLPRLAGSGSLRANVAGRPGHARLEAQGRFEELSVGPAAAQGLGVDLLLPDASRLLDATATLRADHLAVAGRALHEVRGSLEREGRSVELSLEAGGPRLRLHLSGTVDADSRGLLVEALALEFPEAAWALRAPAAVRLEREHLETERLELVSGDQSVSVGGRLRGHVVDGRLEVRRLDLGRLPSLAVPASVGLSGVLDLSAEVHGPEEHPDLTAVADLSGGKWHGLTGLAAHVEGRRSGSQVGLIGHVDALASSADVSLDGPEAALTTRVHRPVSIQLRAAGVDLARSLCELDAAGLLPRGCPGGKAVAAGRLDLDLVVDGYADGPRVGLSASGSDISYRKLPPAAWTLSIEGDGKTPVAVRLGGRLLGGEFQLAGGLEASTAQLLARRRSWAGWRSVPLRGKLQASGIELAPLVEAGLLTREVRGSADGHAEVSGTLADPRGSAEVQLRGLAVEPWPAADLHLALRAEEQLDARLTLTGAGGETGSAHLVVGAPLAQLGRSASPEDLAAIPVELAGKLGPVELRKLPLEASRLRRDRRLLDGELELVFQGGGSLLSPRGTAELTARHLGPSDGAHIDGSAEVRYQEGRHALQATLRSSSGGALDLQGTVDLDLSLPALRRGFHPREAPLRAKLHSERFQPDFVASFVPWLRSVTGTLQVAGQAGGTLGRPKLQGSLAWEDGALGIIGFGLYQGIHLRASASEERFAIEELTARVQGGTLGLRLEGQRGADGFTLQGDVTTRDLPVVFDDQLWCIATVKARLEGTARPWMLDLAPVTITEAELQLPESRRKNLQDLSSPPDVVLTRRGVPIDPRQSLRALALDPRLRGRGRATAEPAASSLLRLALQAPNRIQVRGRDVLLELGLSREFEVEVGEETTLHGEVRIVRGRADVWGRRFEAQAGGRVSFDGPANQPQVNVTGVYTNSQEQVTVYMRFSGVGSDIQVSPSSSPPLSEPEIYTLLATGRTTLKQSSLGSTAAVGSSQAGVSILGSWMAGELKKAVGGALPIDVISIEVQQDRGVQQTRLEAGKYLTDDIYIGYQARIGADPFRYQNANAFRVEYQFLRRWSLQLEYGDANAGSLDAVWSRDY